MRVSTTVLQAAWRAPLSSANGRSAQPRPLVLLRLRAEDGCLGHGEAAPLESYDGVSVPQVLGALGACESVLARSDGSDRAAVLAECRELVRLPQALAAIDLALWDMAGRRAGVPVWKLLGSAEARPLEINAVIGAVDSTHAAAEARAAVGAGFRCVKVKVGVGDDLARLAAVRTAVGPGVGIRIDANGAWATAAEAVAELDELDRHDLELCEEPVHGAASIAEVAASSPVPIAVDESTADDEVFQLRVADAVCLKIAASGGISGTLAAARRARELGYGVFLSSTLDGPLGIAAALHAGTRVHPDRACGLSTLDRFRRPAPFSVVDGFLAPPPGPGLGDGLLEWYAALA